MQQSSGVDRGNTTQAVFSDIINLAVVVESGELEFSNLYSTEEILSAVRSKDHFHWTAPPPYILCTPLVPKVGDCPPPTHPGCAAYA